MPKTRTRMRTRTRKAKKVVQRGGPRPGAGRKPKIEGGLSFRYLVRFSPFQKEALDEYIENCNYERAENGLPMIELSSWIRKTLLEASGNDDLVEEGNEA